ncbi:hypothetical protein EON80_16235 [bacterium]|nr:MAG: hypothetical protein EON80_16235 [bacterium]
MNPNPISWQRSRHTFGGGDAIVYFEVYGDFPAQLETNFDVRGISVSCTPNDFAGITPDVAQTLRESNPPAIGPIETATSVVTISGKVSDPSDLHYLRDSLQLIETLLKNGGVGVVELQSLQVFQTHEWREKFWSDAFEPTFHTTILMSMEADNVWLHTRGMRLFGRPDISCHNVSPQEVELLQPVFNGLMRMQAAGAIIPEGQPVQAVGIEDRLVCRHRGSLDDEEFNNFHIELEWETPRANS